MSRDCGRVRKRGERGEISTLLRVEKESQSSAQPNGQSRVSKLAESNLMLKFEFSAAEAVANALCRVSSVKGSRGQSGDTRITLSYRIQLEVKVWPIKLLLIELCLPVAFIFRLFTNARVFITKTKICATRCHLAFASCPGHRSNAKC